MVNGQELGKISKDRACREESHRYQDTEQMAWAIQNKGNWFTQKNIYLKNYGFDSFCWRGLQKGEYSSTAGWSANSYSLLRNQYGFSQGIGNQSTSRSSNSTLMNIPKRWTYIQKAHLFNYFHSSIIYNSHNLEATLMPINWRIDKENVVYLHNGVLLEGGENMEP